MHTISVDKAISKGHRMVNYPVGAILFGTFGFSLYLKSEDIIPTELTVAGCILAFVLSWLWWSFSITRWRLWAFENVRNVHELKKRAIQEKLIWPDDSIFEKTEIRNREAKEKWNSLQSKFRKADEYFDDLTVPEETIIRYSKLKNYFEMLFGIGCIGLGIYLIIDEEQPILGSGIILVGVYFTYKELKEATNTKPQIILNQKGIETISTPFYPWRSIKNDKVVVVESGKSVQSYLRYDHPKGSEEIEITEFEINEKKLAELLRVYRVRSRKIKQS